MKDYGIAQDGATMTISVRRATLNDQETVVEFNRLLALESEGKALDLALLRPGVAAVLADEQKGLYFLAVTADAVIGQMSVTFEWSDWRNGWFWWLQSVYVRGDWRRRGVFRTLLEHVRQTARDDASVIGLRLYVERENEVAQRTYTGLEFERTHYLLMEKHPL